MNKKTPDRLSRGVDRGRDNHDVDDRESHTCSTESSPSIILKAIKGWEGEGSFIVWHVGSVFGRQTPAKKCYLVLSAEQKHPVIAIREHKPDALKAQGAFANLLRKHVRAPAMGPLWRNTDNGDYWLALHTTRGGPPEWYLHMTDSRPCELRLVDREGTIHIRKSNQGTYTKRRLFEGNLPTTGSKFEDVTNRLFDEWLKDRQDTAHRTGDAPKLPRREPALPDYQRQARDRLSRRLKTVGRYLSRLEKEVPTSQSITTLECQASYLQSYLFLVKKDDHELRLSSEVTGMSETLVINLDPEKTAGQNLQDLFRSVKKAKRAQEIGDEQKRKAHREKLQMERDLERLRSEPLSLSDVQSILRRYRIPLSKPGSGKPGEAPALHFRTYLCDGISYLVGKGSRYNDELTKNARSNDHWLHAVGVTGSHIIIPAKQTGGVLSPDQLRRGAILALHFSKLREDRAGEVYVTRKQHLRKRKGMPAGLWSIEKAESLFYRYDTEELMRILEQLKL